MNEIIQCNCPDYSGYLQSIVDNQAEEIEQLQYQNAILLEQNNGLSLVVNYQFATLGVFVVFAVVLAAWKILSKWFFGGV